MIHTLRSIDAHVGGQRLRLITEGVPAPRGASLADKQAWFRRHADHVRRTALLEPRGHVDMTGAILTEPAAPGSHAGLLFMDVDGYPAMSGHSIIAAATIAIERELLFSRDVVEPEVRLVFDTPAGVVPARARLERRGDRVRVDSVAFVNVPAFVHTAGHRLRIGGKELRVDIAYGGAFYAIVDTEAAGVPLDPDRLPELRRLGVDILDHLRGAVRLGLPGGTLADAVTGVMFTGPPRDPEAHLRNVTVTIGGAVDRSPCGTGTAAVMAVLDAMGLLLEDQTFVHESVVGSLLRGRVAGRRPLAETPALSVEIEGAAWITGEHLFHVDDEDPFREGFVV